MPDGALDWMGMAHLLDELAALPELRQIGPRTPLLTPEQAVIVGHSHARHPLGARGHCPLPGEANVATLERLVAGLAEVLRELRAMRPANPAASPGI